MLLLCRFLDHLERDYQATFPDAEPILKDGYEATLRRLVGLSTKEEEEQTNHRDDDAQSDRK